ncbi:hypothetical protein TSAR_013515 [Trichomalopsis sarcophagae]|uniref:Uncharacterized protein n=1 Tax=Trichomalopsis sarcophagae TaxID=543379 RepID=A0A232FIE7_9HYME|nr:hypothetical protein TSAR_013515 [Trichomalopsis sarcophagae]
MVDLKINPVDSLFDYHDTSLSNRIINGFVNISNACELFSNRRVNYNLRNYRIVKEITCTKNQIFYATTHRVPRLWNNIPIDNRNTDASTFKSNCK